MQSIQLFVNTKPNDVWDFQSASGTTGATYLGGNTEPPFQIGDAVMIDFQGSGTFPGLEGFHIVNGVTPNLFILQIPLTYAGNGNISGLVTYFPEYVELDLMEEEAIRFTKEVSDIDEPARVSSNYTRNFRIPQTSKNGEFFKAIFNVNSNDFDTTRKVYSYINIDGIYFTSGDLRLNQIYVNHKTGEIQYDVIFIGQTGSFGGTVASRLMKELDLTDLSHQVNEFNLEMSWKGYPNGLFGGKVLYPLIEWGYTYDPQTKLPLQNTLSKFDGTFSIRGFTKSGNPLLQQQFKPTILIKELWDKVFEEAGFTYQSQFINWDNPFFQKMYHISTGRETSGATILTGSTLVKYVPQTPGGGVLDKKIVLGPPGFTPYSYIMPNEVNNVIFDPNGILFTESSTINIPSVSPPTIYTSVGSMNRTFFKIPKNGAYRIKISPLWLKCFQNLGPSELDQDINIYIYKNGFPFDSQVGKFETSGNSAPGDYPVYSSPSSVVFNFPSSSTYYFFNKNDEIEIRVQRDEWVSGYANLYISETKSEFVLETDIDNIDLSSFFPDDYKQIDFIKSISDKFKLIWEPDPQNPNNFFIEPWIYWIRQGKELDWTNKLNENKDVLIKPLFQSQSRLISFKDKDEADLYNFSFEQAFKKGFGEVILDSQIPLITGERKIETRIAPIQIAPIGNSETFLIPHLAKDTLAERQPMEVWPRVSFYNGKTPVPQGITAWYMIDDTSTVSIPYTYYPLASNFYQEFPYGPTSVPAMFDGTAFDISWTNVKQFWDANTANVNPVTYGTGRTDQTAFNNFWGTWYATNYSSSSRIMEAEFALETNDIRDLMFNDRIWVRDAWYFPISIKDYVLNEKQNVKVQLLKVGNINLGSLNLYPVQLCYSEPGNPCPTLCCDKILTVYKESPVITDPLNLPQIWMDEKGIIPGYPGWYSESGSNMTYYFDFAGQNTGVNQDLSLCNCNPTLNAIIVCDGIIPTSVCGCSSGFTIYGDGTNLSNSTKLYAFPGGTAPLTPFYWYNEVGNVGPAAQVGEDGITIIQYNNCL